MASKLLSITEFKKLSDEHKELKIKEHINESIKNHPNNCWDSHNKQSTTCSCIKLLEEAEIFNKITHFLLMFLLKNKDEKESIMIGIISNGLVLKGRTDSRHRAFTMSSDLGKNHKFFCKNTISLILNVRQRKWMDLCKKAEQSIVQKQIEKEKIIRNTNLSSITEEAIKFIRELGEREGESHATRFVREGARLIIRDGNTNVIELPSYYSRRHLYHRCCYNNGWDPKATAHGTHGKLAECKKRQCDEILWPIGSAPQPTCAWSTFTRIWKMHLPNIQIRPPSRDTCNDCFTCKMTMQKKKNVVDLDCNSSISDDSEDESIDADEMERTIENNVNLVRNHIEEAREMRALCVEKEVLAKKTKDLPFKERTITLVGEHAQNLGLPHAGEEQPGDTCYFSPLSLFCFGLVDTSKNDGKMSAFACTEGMGKKGGNNVASMILHCLNQLLPGLVKGPTPPSPLFS